MATHIEIGTIFGNWTVLAVLPSNPIKLLCRCACGTEQTTLKTNVVSGKSTKCIACRNASRTIHGGRGTRLHNIWQGMVQRCTSNQEEKIGNYKSQGITLCVEWLDFLVFKSWAEGSGYTPALSLDRKDTYSGYSPENCRWATRSTQSSNKRKMRNNSSGYVGVSEIKGVPTKKWKAYICVAGVFQILGRFSTPKEASAFRDAYIAANNLHDYPTENQRHDI